MELLRAGLAPFVEREVQSAGKAGLGIQTIRNYAEDPNLARKSVGEWDVAALLKLMWEAWNDIFRRTLGPSERGLVGELRGHRNRWAHQDPFSGDDAYRALDSAERLLTAISAPQVEDVQKSKMELLRVRFDEQVRGEKRKTASLAIESQATGNLKPWREVITPHKDVASGRYQQAEFAADLWQVHLGEGSDEYRDPGEFFRRTYLTDSLRQLLVGAIRRLSGQGGDPVVQLQTNFGGGKTHSMLALYHLFSGIAPQQLAGIDAVMKDAGTTTLPRANRVVLVGNRISPGNPVTKPDGTVVRTLWGELAWQLGFAAGGAKEAKKAFARVAADDEKATSPGDALRELCDRYAPCLVLIDEWVAYARQLHDQGELPAGDFETPFTFAQLLTESAKAAKDCLLLVSLPASDTATSPHAQSDDTEVGGQRGREALNRLRNVVERVATSWRPASMEEGFEIVRRRLFEPLIDPEQFKARDLVAREFYDCYRTQAQEFPPECRDPDSEHCVLNPVLCAMEGAGRKRPSETEFRDSFTLACAAIRQRLPRARLIEFGDESVRAVLQTLEDSHVRHLAESRFLIEACPYISDRRPYAELQRTEEAILQSARQCELDLFSLPILAVLSCLYERRDGHEPLIGRKVINPRRAYDESRAHNALSDLRALVYLAAASGLGPANLAYCTRDKHLAALWCSLRFAAGRWRANDVEIDLRLGRDLFPRLSEDEIDALFERLRGQRS
jgi:hypothetical protein